MKMSALLSRTFRSHETTGFWSRTWRTGSVKSSDSGNNFARKTLVLEWKIFRSIGKSYPLNTISKTGSAKNISSGIRSHRNGSFC
jgi:hypothetical protein